MQRDLTKEDEAKLKELNDAVSSAIADRKKWLDSKMSEYAEVQVGENIYHLDSAVCLGKVVRLYRYWQDKNDGILDDDLNINYEYEILGQEQMPNKIYDNTSRQGGVGFGTKAQAIERAKFNLEMLNK